jgi:hypothetical protein
MSLREAAGYLRQLWDLYWLRGRRHGGAPRHYRRLTTVGVESLTSSNAAIGRW